ncbi:MAG: ABC transporter ATP-binding protein [Ilumatobacter sp.]|uniref:ABC transporter ATP-binding protein n=1 Tax=Ilumatobacter sp. TaxID=1967498 RepID=UPI00391C967A
MDALVETQAMRFARLRTNWLLIRSMFMLHPRLFVLAFAGAAVFAVGTVASSFAIKWVIDEVILPRFDEGDVGTSTVVAGLALIIGIGLVRAVGVVIRRSAASAGMWRVAETYTNQVLERLVRQPVSWHRRRADGDLVARAGVDTETTVSVIAPIPFAASTVLMIVISTIWMFVTDIPLGVVAIVVFPLVIIANVVYERSVSVHYSTAQRQLGEFSAAVHESFEGVQLIKSYGAEARETRRLADLADEVRATRVGAIRMRTWFEALQDIIPAVTNIVLVVIGAVRVQSGDVTVGEFTSVIFLFTLLVLPLRLIGYALSELPRSMAAWLRIQEVTNEDIEPDPAGSVQRAPDGFGVVFDGVTFAHTPESGPALRGVDLAIPIGTVTAFVGPTGSGKSTLAELALGLVGPTSGTVRLAPGTRAIVFQEAFLLAGTVRDNIRLGQDVDDDEIWAALHMAVADEFVRSLPNGLDTVVGERGVSLSGGQRQRVALARALVRRPSLLILDDTTSALDPATEATALDRLRSGLSDATVLVIASRPSTIALADDVVFMEAGRMGAHGTHHELLAASPRYRELVEAFETDRSAVESGRTS